MVTNDHNRNEELSSASIHIFDPPIRFYYLLIAKAKSNVNTHKSYRKKHTHIPCRLFFFVSNERKQMQK